MTAPTETPKILLVDDEVINRSVGSRMLAKLGHPADVAGDAHEAIALIRQKAYDLVFTDIQMPELSGLEAVKFYREADQAEGRVREFPLRIIALSADDSEQHRREYLAAGMDDLLGKPVRPDKLRGILERWLPRPPGSAGPPSPGLSPAPSP